MGNRSNSRQKRPGNSRSVRSRQKPGTLKSANGPQPPKATSQNTIPASAPNTPQHRKRNFAIWAVAAAGCVGTAVSIISYLFSDIPMYAKWMAVILTFAVAAVFAPGWHPPRRRRVLTHAASLAAITAIWIGIHVAVQPNHVQRQITALLDETENANIWVSKPAVFRESSSYIEKNFSAFDPQRSHDWEELPVDKVPALTDLVVQAGGYAGNGVVTLGRVGVAQPLGGDQYVVQVTPISQANAESVETRQSVEAQIGTEHAGTLLSDSIVDTNRVTYMLYVRIVLPPLGALPTDETVLVKGTPIAYGRTQDRTGRQMDVAYLVGSNIRRFYDSPRLSTPLPTQTPEPQSSE